MAVVALSVSTLLAVTGCGSGSTSKDGFDSNGSTVVPSSPLDGGRSDSSTSGNPSPDTETQSGPPPPIRLERVDVDLEAPTAAVALPEPAGGLLVAERRGVVRFVDPHSSPPRMSRPLVDIFSDVTTDMERGLLGIAITSGDRPRLLLSYTNSDGDTRLDSYAATWVEGADTDDSPVTIDRSSRVELLAVDQPFANHNGGHIEIGPDGMLYMGLGDGGAGGDPYGNAQDRSTLLGKLLRLDPTATSSAALVPSDNPFVGVDGVEPEIWSTGLRNPWRFSFDSSNGDLWIADVGENRFEEVNRVTDVDGAGRGANFGWDMYEGLQKFPDADPAPPPASDGPFTEPVHVYEHGPGCSVTGGRVYRGEMIPGLVGRYLFTDFCDGTIRSLTGTPDGTFAADDLGATVDQPIGFAADDSGELYVLSLTSGLLRIIPD